MYRLRINSTVRFIKVIFPMTIKLIIRQKTCLTSSDYEYLRNIPRMRNILVEDFMLTPSWFSQSVEKDVREIARFVMNGKDQESRKLNARLYKFATGQSAKTNAGNTKYI
jgi:hypothetical protein